MEFLDEETYKLVVSYLTKSLEGITQAELSTLAHYIIALLKNDKPDEELKELCIEQLEAFLKSETKPFVNKLFEHVIKNLHNNQLLQDTLRKYIGSEEQKYPIHDREKHYYRSMEDRRRTSRSPDIRRYRSKHRRERDDTPEIDLSRDYDRRDLQSHRERSRERESPRSASSFDNRFKTSSSSSHRFDRKRTASGAFSNGGNRIGRSDRSINDRLVNGDRSSSGFNAKRPKTQLCRDYSQKGVCYRGSSCNFIHESPIVVENQSQLNHLNLTNGLSSQKLDDDFGIPQYNNSSMGYYSPTHPYYGSFKESIKIPLNGFGSSSWNQSSFSVSLASGRTLDSPNSNLKSIDNFGLSSNFVDMNEAPRNDDFEFLNGDVEEKRVTDDRTIRDSNWRENNNNTNSNRGSDRKFRRERRNVDPDNTTLTITNIPFALNSIEKLSSHFKRFGQLVNIQINKKEQKAILQFSSHSQALKALKSPEAVLGNRFIRVFWSRETERNKIEDDFTVPVNQSAEDLAKSQKQMTDEEVKQCFDKIRAEKVEKVKQLQQKTKDLTQLTEEHVKKQEALIQSLFQITKKENISKESRQRIIEKIGSLTKDLKETLVKSQQSISKLPVPQIKKSVQKKVLLNGKEENPSDSTNNSNSIANPENHQNDKDLEENRSSTENETSVAASGEPESDLIEPENNPNLRSFLKNKLDSLKEQAAQLGILSSSERGGYWRGKYRQRGRGRGRGFRNSRGGFSSHVLDNRTTSFVIHDIPVESLDADKLKEHFRVFGDVTDVALYGSDAVVTMSNRRSAEKAIKLGNTLDTKELAINWYTPGKDFESSVREEVNSEENVLEQGEEQPIVEEFLPSGSFTASHYDSEEDDEMERKR